MKRFPLMLAGAALLIVVGSIGVWQLSGDGSSRPAALTSVDPRHFQILAIDLAGDGLHMDGSATVKSSGCASPISWTQPGNDDGFIAIDPAALKAAGYKVAAADGTALGQMTIVGSGLVVTAPSGKATQAVGAFDVLRLLDSNGDGKLTSADRAFSSLRLFHDDDGDGHDDPGETGSLEAKIYAALRLVNDQVALDLQTTLDAITQSNELKSAVRAAMETIRSKLERSVFAVPEEC